MKQVAVKNPWFVRSVYMAFVAALVALISSCATNPEKAAMAANLTKVKVERSFDLEQEYEVEDGGRPGTIILIPGTYTSRYENELGTSFSLVSTRIRFRTLVGETGLWNGGIYIPKNQNKEWIVYKYNSGPQPSFYAYDMGGAVGELLRPAEPRYEFLYALPEEFRHKVKWHKNTTE